MLTFLSYTYALLYLGWSVIEVRDLRRSRYPIWLVLFESASKLFLLIGIVITLAGGSSPLLPHWWFPLLLLVVAVEVCLRTLAFRNEERDLDLPEGVNTFTHALAFTFGLAFVAPAVIMNYHAARREITLPIVGIFIIPAALGILVGGLSPKLRSVFSSSNEREMFQWLKSSSEFSSAPDKIEYLDSRKQRWPGTDIPEECHLFRVWFGDKSYIGLNGPTCYCLPEPMPDDIDLEHVYEMYRDWYADKLSRQMIKHAAKDLPEDFRAIVDGALDESRRDSRPM